MAEQKDKIIDLLKEQINEFQEFVGVEKTGEVVEIADGIAQISGLADVMASEMLDFGDGIMGVALNLEEGTVGAMILGDWTKVSEGTEVKSTGRILSIPVSDKMVGRVIDPLGRPVDGKGSIEAEKYYPVEKIASGVMSREPVDTPVQTGIKAIDSMIPIGRGQRELIIGDRQIGKTAIAIDTIINQKNQDLTCIYVAVGQKESKIAKIVAKLEETGAMEHTIVVVAGASDPASLSYLAPFTGCAIGEYFMDKGEDALIVYDDLSKHAWAYREISLLLRRPPGREAYPGDIFYLHSRLLERAAKHNEKHGGGSLTALPIIETQAGDVSAYIPTNVISITDGQIYLESSMFFRGIRPALNVGLSVSRVGSAAQIKAMKSVAGKLRLDLAQFRELEAFAQFATDLDEATRKQLERGKRTVEILKQGQYSPMAVENQVVVLYAVTNGYVDEIPIEDVQEWEDQFIKYMNSTKKDVMNKIIEKKVIDDELESNIKSSIEEFNQGFKK